MVTFKCTEEHCYYCDKAFPQAAETGNLKLLQWLKDNGYPWDHRTCTAAARNGHLEAFIWLRVNGCPYDEQMCIQAAGAEYPNIVEWIIGNRELS